MQDRYVGDVGDFGKYGLLRLLCSDKGCPSTDAPLRLAVVWCLYPDEDHNADGKHIGYLSKSRVNERAFRSCDPELYDALRRIVASGRRRVSSVVDAGILPEDTIYYDRVLYYPRQMSRRCREYRHSDWIAGALAETIEADIVFVDPDNGIYNGPLSLRQKAPKYTFVEDLLQFARHGQSLVIYHHLSRQGKAIDQIRHLAERLRTEMGSAQPPWALWYHRGSARCYFIVAQDRHAARLSRGLDQLLDSGWSAHFEMVQ